MNRNFEQFKNVADRVSAKFRNYFINHSPAVMDYDDIKQIAYLELINMLDTLKNKSMNDNQFASLASIKIWGIIMNELEKKSDVLENVNNTGEELTDNSNPEKEVLMKECLDGLNDREKIILEMLKNGAKQKDIAACLKVSQPRVCLMIKKMREKMVKATS